MSRWHGENEHTPWCAGRMPWRARMQLRHQRPWQAVAAAPSKESIVCAAGRAQPPAYWSGEERSEAGRRLLLLCEWLDAHLERPLRVTGKPAGGRQIDVFESLAYRVEPGQRRIVSGPLRDGQFEPQEHWVFEIGRPLISSNCLSPLVQHLGVAEQPQRQLFFAADFDRRLPRWLADTAYRLLLRQPAFRRLREFTLPQALALPRDVHAVALACRARPQGPLLHSRAFNTVWENDDAFRTVARENPQLLPLFFAFVVEKVKRGELSFRPEDAVAALKRELLAAGVSQAGWRYLTRWGARLVRLPWAIAHRQPAFGVAVRYLTALQDAGLPPPPPPSITKVWLHGANPHEGDCAHVDDHFREQLHPRVLRAGLIEADRRRRHPGLAPFVEEFLNICWHFTPENFDPDANQQRAGWAWLVRAWQRADAEKTLLQSMGARRWRTRLPQQAFGRWQVVPIRSAEELIRESLALKNCLRDHAEQCAAGEVEIYVIRDSISAKTRGCIGFAFDADGVPSPKDVKGLANTPPPGEFRRIAGELFVRLQHATEDRSAI